MPISLNITEIILKPIYTEHAKQISVHARLSLANADNENYKETYHHSKAQKLIAKADEIYSWEQEFYKRKYLHILKMEYQLGQNLPDRFKVLKEREHTLRKQLQKKIARDNNNGYLWVTINPCIKKTTLEKFVKKVDVIAKRKCFIDYIYVFEQRATKIINIGNGYHAHLLLKRNLKYKPCKCRENLQSSCKKLMPNPKNPQTLDIQIIGEEFARDKLDYILGIKTGEKSDGQKKSIAQKLDKKWRKQEKLAEYYGEMARII